MIRMALSGELVGLVGLSGDKGQTSNYVEVIEVSDMEFWRKIPMYNTVEC